jgi:diaminohydroxyphosphoribosylaminopyrimidine deaminase / 5-amino-6-(5-phosphoribosylamino)uracil reductase
MNPKDYCKPSGFFIADRGMMEEKFMALALEMAEKGRGGTSPNPMVGAVLVKRDRIIAKGYHRRAGLPHAEVNALKMAGKEAEGGTLYVNLEPCCHFGKTPPCTDTIVKSKVKKIIIGMRDPNPLVAGKGVKILKKAGIEVAEGVLEKECKRLNEKYIKFITSKRPFVTLKVGESLDGKIATVKGDTRWITGIKSREFVHRLRDESDAIMVGINTVMKDDPALTTRIKGKKGKNPKRIIIDSSLRIPLKAKVLNKDDTDIFIATTGDASEKKIKRLQKKGIQILATKKKQGRVDLDRLMQELGKLNITSLLIEGGGEINASAINEGIVDKVMFFISPIIIGGKEAPSSVSGKGFPSLKEALTLRDMEVKRLDKDILIQGYLH